ncbi:transposase [Bradyrhizobium elkanii]|jgi:transposase|uniref:transposase n=1 Tax=Bradyrhizobium elkanii TaxID=29448 RepID=UPI0004B1C87B
MVAPPERSQLNRPSSRPAPRNGLDLISAATFVAAIGDLARVESARHLIVYLGLVPSEQRIRCGGITKAGNSEARRMLIKAAWSYRFPPRIAKEKAEAIVRLPKAVRILPVRRSCGSAKDIER